MKKTMVKLLGAGVLIGTLFVVSCKKDKLTKEEALQMEANLAASKAKLDDSLRKAGGIIHYSVFVYQANNASGKKEQTEGVSGVNVTLTQNGKTTTVATDGNGFAVFPDCRIGNVVVIVSGGASFATMDYKTSLDPGLVGVPSSITTGGNLYDIIREVSTMVPIFGISGALNTATIKGNATIETDLTNVSREVAPVGTMVSAYIDATSGTFTNTFLNDESYTANNNAGRPTDVIFETALSTTTTDAAGNYSLTVPAAVDNLPVVVYFADITATQTLVFRYWADENPQPSTWAMARTVRTNFSQSFTSANGNYSNIPAYSPVTATVSAPPAQGSGAAVSLKFKANDVDGDNGNINVVQTGTLTPGYYSVTVTGGSYDANLTTPQVSAPASITLLVGANGMGSLIGSSGYGYRSQPSLTVNYTGVNAVTLAWSSPWDSEVADFNVNSTTFNDGDAGSTITSGGSGYVVDPTVTWYYGSSVYNPTTSCLTTLNGVVVDVCTDPQSDSYTTLPTVVFTPAPAYNAVISSVTINGSGGVSGINTLNNGAGYSTLAGSLPPTVTFNILIPGYSPTSTAIVNTTVNGSGALSFSIVYAGAGYPVANNANTPQSFVGFQVNGTFSSASINVKPNNVYVRDIYYGTGFHERGAL